MDEYIFGKIKELAIHYPYDLGTCKYVYTAHGDKAEEIIKTCAGSKLQSDQVCMLSDTLMSFTSVNEVTLRLFEPGTPKLPRKLRNGWA